MTQSLYKIYSVSPFQKCSFTVTLSLDLFYSDKKLGQTSKSLTPDTLGSFPEPGDTDHCPSNQPILLSTSW